MAVYINNFFRLGACFALVLALTGCATVRKPSLPSTSGLPPVAKTIEKKGIQHKVAKGETVWRIAKTYKVSVDDIIRANAIPNAASIEEDQLVFIPGAEAVKEVAVASPSDKDTDYAWPVKGKVISYFDDRKGPAFNAGIDVNAVEGELVKASRPGRVVLADHLPGYGYAVIIDHGDGYFTVYAHNERIMVQLGDYVFKGEKIAQVAREGNLAYLHFEVRRGQKPSNPLHYLP